MTRVLMIGDLAPTGFGTVTTDLGRELIALGEDMRFLSQNELGQLTEPFKSRTFVLDKQIGWQRAASEGKLTIAGVLDGSLWPDRWQAEAVLVLGDFYAARGVIFLDERGEEAFKAVPTWHYCPVEGIGLPPSWAPLWEIARPVAMSHFGAREIAKVTGIEPPVVYHGVNTEVFYPVSATRPIRLGTASLRSKEEAKAYFKIPAGWEVLLRTDTNVVRKQWPSLLRALENPMAAHPQSLFLMHTRSADEGGDLRDAWSHIAAGVRRRMVNLGWKDRGFVLGRPELNALYNAADVYVSNSPEGFGLTIAEALACGVPAVGIDESAVPEVIGPAGRLAPVAWQMDNPYGHKWAVADERAFGKEVNSLLDDVRERKLLGAKGPNHVRSSFSWKTAAAQFSSLFATVHKPALRVMEEVAV